MVTTTKKEIRSGYQQTDVGVIPHDWEVKRLGDIGESIIGLTYKPSDVSSTGLLVLRSSNVFDGKLRFDDNVFVNLDVPERIVVKLNDILICVRNGSRDLIGKCALIDERAEGMTFGAFMTVYRSDSAKFIFQQFQSNLLKKQINEHLGATINQITNKSLNSFKIPIPKEAKEQDAISRALSDIDSLVSLINLSLTKKKDVRTATMQRLLSGKQRLPGFKAKWQKKMLGDIGSTYGGLSGKTKKDFDGGEYPYIPFMNIMTNPVIDTNSFDYVNIAQNERQNTALKGDLFFNGSSETPEEVGMCSVLQEDIPNLYLNSFCFGFRMNKEPDAVGLFFAYFFRSNEGRKLFYSLAQGATRYNLSKGRFLKMEIPYPEPAEQAAIAEVLSTMDIEILETETRLRKAQELKQGMMQKLLTGRIRLI